MNDKVNIYGEDLNNMNKFDSKNMNEVKDFEAHLYNLAIAYRYKPEESYPRIKEYLNTLSNSKKKKEILETFDISQIFISTDFNEFTKTDVEELFHHFKILYKDTKEISDDIKNDLYRFFERLNERYYQLTDRFFIPQNFKDSNIKTVIRKIK